MKSTHKCKICLGEFSGFYALRQHKKSEHGVQMKSAEFDVNNLIEDDDAGFKEELQSCLVFLVDSELEKGRHRFFNFATSTFDNSLVNKKLDLVFKALNCAAKVNFAFGFVLKNVANGSCIYFFMLTRTIRSWRGRNFCVHQTTLTTWTRNDRKRILSIFVNEREPILNGSFRNWQIWQFLQSNSKMYPWVVKIPYYLNRSWKVRIWIV